MMKYFGFFMSLSVVLSCGGSRSGVQSPFNSESAESNYLCEDKNSLNSLNTLNTLNSFSTKVIYGNDNRVDMYNVCNSKYIEMSQSTLALVDESHISSSSLGVEIYTYPFGKSYNLCSDELFYHQRIGAFCSAFLVDSDIVVTAGHCVPSLYICQRTKFIFGYELQSPNHDPSTIPLEDVYTCRDIIQVEYGGAGEIDYAIIQLDRNVLGRKPLQIRRSGIVSIGSPLLVIGHPSGLPKKVSSGAAVRSMGDFYFISNLDTYGGNSGSAVFNSQSGLVEGVLVRGEVDYKLDERRNCNVSFRCSDHSCAGEEVVKITELLEYLPEKK